MLMNLIKSQRLLLDTFEHTIAENPMFDSKLEGEPKQGEDIFGNRFTPLQMFMAKIKLGESDNSVEE